MEMNVKQTTWRRERDLSLTHTYGCYLCVQRIKERRANVSESVRENWTSSKYINTRPSAASAWDLPDLFLSSWHFWCFRLSFVFSFFFFIFLFVVFVLLKFLFSTTLVQLILEWKYHNSSIWIAFYLEGMNFSSLPPWICEN